MRLSGDRDGVVLIAGRLGVVDRSQPRAGGRDATIAVVFRRKPPEDSAAAVNPVSPFLGPLVAALATGMVTARLLPHVRSAICFERRGGSRGSVVFSSVLCGLGLELRLVPGGHRFCRLPVLDCFDRAAGRPATSGRIGRCAAIASCLGRWPLDRVPGDGAVVTVPLAEELAFRGFLTPPDCGAVRTDSLRQFFVVLFSLFVNSLWCAASLRAGWHSCRDVLRRGCLPPREAGGWGLRPRDDQRLDRRAGAGHRGVAFMELIAEFTSPQTERDRISTRSQALPGNALPCRLRLPLRSRRDVHHRSNRGRASIAVRSQAEPGTERGLKTNVRSAPR